MLAKGTRVQLHPATDRWMMGDRYGEIVYGYVSEHYNPKSMTWIVDRTTYRVKLDKSGKTICFQAADVMSID